jgi:uncharacterized membrane protein
MKRNLITYYGTFYLYLAPLLLFFIKRNQQIIQHSMNSNNVVLNVLIYIIKFMPQTVNKIAEINRKIY